MMESFRAGVELSPSSLQDTWSTAVECDSFFIPSSHCGSGSPYVRERDINSDLSSLQSKDAPDLQQSSAGHNCRYWSLFIGDF